MMSAAGRRTRNHRPLDALRAALLAGATVLALPAAAQEADLRAAEIQSLLDRDRADEAEKLAREALAGAETALAAQALETANLHRLLGDALYGQNRFEEAEPHFRKAMTLREEHLGEHADTAVSVADYAYTLRQLGRLGEAEPYYRRALDIRIAVLGPDDAETARSWQRLARLVDQRGDHLRAAGLMDEAIRAGIAAFGADDAAVMTWTGERAAMLHDGGRLDDAERDYRAVIAAAQAGVLMAQGPEEATAQTGLANLLRAQRRDDEVEALYRAALATRERMHGPVHALVASVLENLGRFHEEQGRGEEALAVFRRALSIRDTVDGDFNPRSADLLFRIGTVLKSLDRLEQAERALRRLLTMRETLDGPDAAPLAEVWRALASVAGGLDRKAEAEHGYKRALAIDEAHLPADHVDVAFDLLMLGIHLTGQQRFSEARPLLERAVAILEGNDALRGSLPSARAALAGLLAAQRDHEGATELMERSLRQLREDGGAPLQLASSSIILADMRVRQERWDEADALAGQAAAILDSIAPESRTALRVVSLRGEIAAGRGDLDGALGHFGHVLGRLEAIYGADHSETIGARAMVGRTLFALGDHGGAAEALSKSARLVERLAEVDAATAFAARTADVEDQAIARGAIFDGLVKTYARLDDEGDEIGYAERAFLVAQRVIESQAAQALAQMAARQAAGDGALAALARARQDAVSRWRRADAKLTAALASPPGKRDTAAVEAVRAEIADADAAIAAIDARLAAGFPDFAALQRPAPIDFDAVRQRLRDDEILLFFADTGAFGGADWETYLWAVPKAGEPRWVRLPRSTGELMTAVRELRALMGVAGEARGASLLGAGPDARDRPARVLAAAHALYGATLGPVADMIEGKELVLVPSGRLAALPFHLLVEKLPAEESADRWRDAGWLALEHAVTVLPSVSALGATAGQPDGGTGRAAYLGFANPLLTGRHGTDMSAFGRDRCADIEPPKVIVAAAAQEPPDLSALFRGAMADVEAVRLLAPLPETADEACAVAGTLGARPEAVLLGRSATEAEAKRLSDTGAMAAARILHFATHGLISGELEGLAEPAIVLTPPAEASAQDDGLLTASEVSMLKLDADWVILSACNTAAGGEGGEALSGLARAFFYAGARSLMVSHWPVASEAAVRLATGAIGEIAGDPSISRAEALRRAMAAEIGAGGSRADPASWAPFIVVGG